MIQCGIGVGVGWGGGGGISPGALASQLAQIYGANLVGLWIGEDIVGTVDATSWAPRVGSVSLTNGSTNLFQVGAVGRRKCLTNSTVNDKLLRALVVPSFKSVLAVGYSAELPGTEYRGMVSSAASAGFPRHLTINSGTSNWTNTGNVKVNGAASNAVPAVLSVLESTVADAATRLDVGNDAGALATRTWLGTIALVGIFTEQPAAGESSAGIIALRRYYPII